MFATTISLAAPLARPAPRARTTALPGFARGTLLRTITGPRAVERIMAGDLLLDADGQIVELRSLRSRQAKAHELVEITPAALGLGLAPALRCDSLIAGAGQKLGMRDWRTDLIYGAPALTEAQALIDSGTVQRPERGAMLYRLGFDRDCVVVANGMPALVRGSDA
ncbi:MAG: Hint domain-containing protein [Natronohydrobacter sp.]|nr:Hint domain-containing protein [Natronohydrobacter sp.]